MMQFLGRRRDILPYRGRANDPPGDATQTASPKSSRATPDRRTVVAEAGRRVVGIVQSGDFPDFGVTPRLMYLAIRVFGPIKLVRLMPRLRARGRVQPKRPRGAYHIAEIDVDPSFRNQGIGSALLDHVEAAARAGGYARMSLTTTTINPARRLYERHGFNVVETKTDAADEKYTGIEGRHLMVKELE